jgi:hypothetical protein
LHGRARGIVELTGRRSLVIGRSTVAAVAALLVCAAGSAQAATDT